MTARSRSPFAALLLAAVLALAPAPSRCASFSPWTYLNKTHGLAENTVQALARDPDGGIWAGTRGGLSRYDGAGWRTFTAAEGLPDNDVHSIFLEPGGRLWVGAGAGFGHIESGTWNRLGLPSAQGQGGRVSVVTDRDGAIWFGHAGGLLRFDSAAGSLAPVPQLAGNAVSALLVDREGRLWAGLDGELRRHESGDWSAMGVADGVPPGRVTALLEDARGGIWCGTETGVAEFDGGAWRTYGSRDGIPAAAVTSLAEDGEGRIWVGTRRGAGYYDGYEWFWWDARSGLPADEVLSLLADPNGSVWLGTTRGLARFDTSWVLPETLGSEEKPPRAPLFVSRAGKVYVATDAGFLERGAGRSGEYFGKREGIGARVTAFAEDGEGDLWVGTTGGLYRFRDGSIDEFLPPEPRQEFYVPREGVTEVRKVRDCDRRLGLKDELVTALAADPEGGVWVGTNRGLSHLRDGAWRCLEDTPLAAAAVTAIASDPRSGLWVGTADGLWTLGEGGWTRFDRPAGLAGDAVSSLLVDRRGALWVGTDRGVSRREGTGWVTITTRDGLVSNRVRTIFEDGRGRLWFGTVEGVSCFDGELWSSFGQQDGLPSPRITAVAEVAGHLWFGSDEGVAVHRPDRAPPGTRIRNPPVGPVGTPFCLFEFAGSDLETAADGLRYSWRLDGGPWTPFAPEPLVTVSDLANGRHTFEVRSLDRGLNADPSPASVTFEVNTGLFDLELVEATFEPLYASLYQFYATDAEFGRRPVGRLRVRSKYDRPLRVKVSAFLADLMDFPTDTVVTIGAGETVEVPLRIELNDRVLDVEKNETRQVRVTLQYTLGGERKESESTHAVTLVEKHGMVWDEPERIGLYVTHLDEAVERFARETVRGFREDERTAIVYDNLLRAMELFDALGVYGVRYLPDPENPYGGIVAGRPTLDVVRLPRETLRSRAGDCDDVAVLYAALLQNIGIDTALVDVTDHVFVMFDTGLKLREGRQLARDPSLLHVDGRERVWVPVEVTVLGQSFTEAWKTGAATMKSRPFSVIEMKEAWKKYAPLRPRTPAPDLVAPPREAVLGLFAEDLRRQEEELTSPEVKRLQQRVAADPGDAAAVNGLGVLLARGGYLGQAAARFSRVIELLPAFAGGYSNLGNILYEQGKYQEAVKLYEESLRREERPQVHVELALTWCELGDFAQAREHYRRAMALEPGIVPGEAGR
jgi:ligand-binding sensor domain-containing protein/tetratricopeptide (TPR) repeat protein